MRSLMRNLRITELAPGAAALNKSHHRARTPLYQKCPVRGGTETTSPGTNFTAPLPPFLRVTNKEQLNKVKFISFTLKLESHRGTTPGYLEI